MKTGILTTTIRMLRKVDMDTIKKKAVKVIGQGARLSNGLRIRFPMR
jgi:hypothetical protein